MSRSALWRQEGNVKERERQAEELYESVHREGLSKRNALPLWGNRETFNLHPVLFRSILQSPYFQKICRTLQDWNALVDEIYYRVDSLNAFTRAAQQTPSTAFCLLLRLFTLRCTEKQMNLLIAHTDSPYIRAIGFLYLRYAVEPKLLKQYVQPHNLLDSEQVRVHSKTFTLGEWLRQLLSSVHYHSDTPLPRLPRPIEQEWQVQLLQVEQIQQRAQQHRKNHRTMEYFQRIGAHVMALYGDDENPITWYPAQIDRILTHDPESKQPLDEPKYVVTFPEYGNTETVSLGELDLPNRQSQKDDLYEQVRRREREQVVVAKGRSYAPRRPPSTKVTMAMGGGGAAAASSSRRGRPPSPPTRRTNKQEETSKPTNKDAVAQPPRKRTAEELAAIQDKKRKLQARYG